MNSVHKDLVRDYKRAINELTPKMLADRAWLRSHGIKPRINKTLDLQYMVSDYFAAIMCKFNKEAFDIALKEAL